VVTKVMNLILYFLKLLYSCNTETSPKSFPICFAFCKHLRTSKQSSIDKLNPCPARGWIVCAASPINAILFWNGFWTYLTFIGYICALESRETQTRRYEATYAMDLVLSGTFFLHLTPRAPICPTNVLKMSSRRPNPDSSGGVSLHYYLGP